MGRMSEVKAYFYQPAAWLEVTGEDAPAFLQSQFSNDLAPAEAGRCTYGLWLDRKGKVQADGWVLCQGLDRFYVHSYFSEGRLIRGKLESHIIADDVEVAEANTAGALSLYGAGAEAFLAAAGAELPGGGHYRDAGGAVVFRGRRSLEPSFELIFLKSASAEKWKAEVGAAGIEIVSDCQIHSERIRSGIPAVPFDIGPSDLPAEGGLEADALSFTKGCFIGQEVVARMHHLGRPQRALFRVSGSGPLPGVPAPLIAGGGRAAGELRSLAPAENGWTGIALLKRREAEPGARVCLGETPVSITDELPGTKGKHHGE